MVLALLLLLGGTALPPFEFRSFIAGQPVPAAALEKCEPDRRGQTICKNFYDRLAGERAVTMVAIYDGKLSWIGISTAGRNYPTLLKAFREKYGPPCNTTVEKWQNRLGTTVDNEIVDWCFATGTLRLKAIGSRLDESFAFYADANAAPADKPKVDF